MIKVIYGANIVPIGAVESFVKCPVCESHQYADVMVESHYYHVYWFPMFPFDKTATIICQNCGLKRTQMEISDHWFSDSREIKKQHRHPLYSYIGVAIIALVIALLIIDPD